MIAFSAPTAPRLLAVSLLLLSVAACGQRGPLYLPSQGIPASQRAPAPPPSNKKEAPAHGSQPPADTAAPGDLDLEHP